jgi:hypothetical protein
LENAPTESEWKMDAETIALILNGRRAGKGWSARCPAHDDRHSSLSICESNDNKVWRAVQQPANWRRLANIGAARPKNVPLGNSRDPF